MKRSLAIVVFTSLITAGVSAQHMGRTKLEVKDLPSPPAIDAGIIDSLEASGGYNSLSDEEKQWFYWTNYSRVNPRRFWDSAVAPLVESFSNLRGSFSQELRGELYRSPRLPFLMPGSKLLQTAGYQAADIANNGGRPSHTSSNGQTFQDRMQKAGIATCAGENISYGASNPLLMLVLLYIDEGVPERGHRRSLLNPAFTEMGIGIAKLSGNNVVVVQDFSCPQSN